MKDETPRGQAGSEDSYSWQSIIRGIDPASDHVYRLLQNICSQILKLTI